MTKWKLAMLYSQGLFCTLWPRCDFSSEFWQVLFEKVQSECCFFFSRWAWHDWSVFFFSPNSSAASGTGDVTNWFYLARKNLIGLFWVRQKWTALIQRSSLPKRFTKWMYYKNWIVDFQNVCVAIFLVATEGTAAKNPTRSENHFSRTLQYKNKRP